MADSAFSDRLARAMAERGMKQVDLIRAAEAQGKKLGKGQVSQYVSGKTVPRPDVMALLAAILGVGEGWLSGAGPARPASVPVDAALPASAPRTLVDTPAAQPQRSTPMREFKKSSKLDNVLYDVRGPVVDEASRMEEDGARILKLNIGNPAPFGFRAPDEVVFDMRQQLTECEGYSDSRGLFSARKAIMQYAQVQEILQAR